MGQRPKPPSHRPARRPRPPRMRASAREPPLAPVPNPKRILGCPLASVYKGSKGGGVRPALVGGAQEESYSYRALDSPPFPCPSRRGGRKGERRGRKGGAPPPTLHVLFGLEGEGARGLPSSPLSLHYGPIRPIHLPGGSGSLPILR